jgi:hypothetical protein
MGGLLAEPKRTVPDLSVRRAVQLGWAIGTVRECTGLQRCEVHQSNSAVTADRDDHGFLVGSHHSGRDLRREPACWRRRQVSQRASCPGGQFLASRASSRLTWGLSARSCSGPIPADRGAWAREAGTVAEQGGRDGADHEGGPVQYGVPRDRGLQPDLRLVQAKAVLPGLEAFLHRLAQAGGADQPGLGSQLPLWHVAVMIRPAHRS